MPPSPPSDLPRALELLYRRNLHVVRLGLEPMRALLERLGRPQDAFLSVHVAGTNGKGSVSAMLASVLRATGLRTGLYTSPHLVRFNERVVVDGEPIADADLAGLLYAVDDAALAAVPAAGRDATFFEFTTALAFEHFRRAGVQVAVVETGLGGRLDATNTIEPLASVITSIGYDHQQFLGDTLEKIAGEKAGIIKPGRAVVCGELPPEALAVVRKRARELDSPVRIAAESVEVRRVRQDLSGQRIRIDTQDASYGPLVLPLLGAHQLGNCAVAVAALEHLRDAFRLPVTGEAILRGLPATRWPARFQVLHKDPPVILDGAHNPQAAMALARTLDDVAKGRPLALVAGFLADKDAAGFLRMLAGRVDRCWAVPLHGERAMTRDQLLLSFHAAGLEPETASLPSAVQAAVQWARENEGLVCIAGSLHLAGEVLALGESAYTS